MLLAWLAVAGVGGPLVGGLSSLQKNDRATFLPEGSESTRAAAEAAAFTSGQGVPFFLVVERDGGLRPDDMGTIQRFLGTLAERPLGAGAQGGSGESTASTVQDLLAAPPRAVIPSETGGSLLAPITLTPDALDKVGEETGVVLAADTIRDAAGELRDAGLTPYLTGPAGYIADLSGAFAGIDGLLLGVALTVVFIILLVVYRSPLLPIVVLLCAIFGLAAAALVVHPLAQADIVQLSGQSQGILSILVVGASTDYALLLVARYRDELHQHESTWTAMRRAWRGSVEPIAASAATVILGLLCLLLSDLGSTKGLGPVSAIGIVFALVAALTYLPAMLLLLGRRAFWPVIPKVDHVHAEDVLGRRGIWAALSRQIGTHSRRVWVGTALVLIVAALFAPQFRADGLTQAQLFSTEVESVRGERVLDEHFPGGTGSPARVVVAEADAARVIETLSSVEGVDAARPSMPAGTSAPPPGDRADPGAPPTAPTAVDGKVLIEATLADPPESPGALATVERARTALDAVSPDLNLGGLSATTYDTKLASERDTRVVMPAILLVVLLVLIVLLRCLVAPILLAVANLLSFLAALGVSALLFNHVFGFVNADPATPLYGFVFLIALGVDYSIFLITRIREEAPRRGTRPAVLVGLAVTGGVITSAGIVLAATFSALIVLPLVFMAQIAFIVAFGVLLDTLVVRSVLVPGLSYDIGSKIWWPSRLTRTARTPDSG